MSASIDVDSGISALSLDTPVCIPQTLIDTPADLQLDIQIQCFRVHGRRDQIASSFAQIRRFPRYFVGQNSLRVSSHQASDCEAIQSPFVYLGEP